MQVSVSDTGGLGKRLEVAVPAEEVAGEVAERLKRLSRTARLKGFRPGKAPLAVITKQFGEQVRAEVVSDLMRSSFAQAVTQEKLKPAGGPRIEPIAVGPGTDLKYAAHFEVLPEVRVRPPESLSVERPSAAVTDADVDAMIENMRAQRPVFTPVERDARASDRVVLDYRTQLEGKPLDGGDAHDVSIVLGARRVMPELEEGLKGARAGEQRTVTAVFPSGHPNKLLAGRSAELHLSVKRVEEQSLATVDEEFLRAYGVEQGGLERMRAEVRASMEQELAGAIRGRVRGQVLEALYRDNPLELPRTLVEEQVQQLQIEAARRAGAREASQIPPREPFEEPGRRRVALGLLLSQVVQTQGLKADPERVRARLEQLVGDYPNPDEARRAYQQSPEAMRQVESAVLEDQVVDWVLAQARVTERPMTFAELTGFGRTDPAQPHEYSAPDPLAHAPSAHGHAGSEHPAHEHDHAHDHGPEPTALASDP